ncbi:TonB-dependent receptor plug domain-containing protein [Alteromonas sp. a30]|uniref:TonB-dependent receptor plug domain-containing protein n=1 Tax=Alteromonas sp. a30 TaxID=2730917 RepID=UPI0022804C4D|nr:TonB-dependent receptor [Alteromonas sp. a30]MCY7296644.1 TonB-dependent receptor [Alteromonas sp. a30]
MNKKNMIVLALLFSQVAAANMLNEHIEVIGQAPHYQRALLNILPAQQLIDESSFSADSVATLLDQSPIVNLNGQGGLFQSINIRGFARWRVQTLIEGIPIHTERRAGTAVEFIPPSFIGQAFVTQGAASTQLGSGAIGGGVDLVLSAPENNAVKLNWGQVADYREIQFEGKTNTDDTHWLVNHRHANNSEDARGNVIQDRFEQHSIALRHQLDAGRLREGLLLYSSANNIAKASADDPAKRFTLYPNNDHWLGKLDFDWLNATTYFHHAKQRTIVERPALRTNSIDNQFLDFGAQIHDDPRVGQYQLYWRAGVDARTNVQGFEQEISAQGDDVFARLTLDAEQWESFISAEFSRNFGQGTWIGGSRLAQQYQHDKLSQHSHYDTNLSAFAGYAHQFAPHWQWSTYVSQAYRVPSLTERYFDGSTPRGQVKGSLLLETETTLNAETSVSYRHGGFDVSITMFQQDIDDYIERIRVADDIRAYRNIDNATVSGGSYQGRYQFALMQLQWKIHFSGQWLHGENNSGQAIADISPTQHRLSVVALGDRSQGFVTLTHRHSSDHLVDGELPVSSVLIMDAGYQYQVNDRMQLAVNLTNVTNQDYVTSRDDLAPFAKSRDLNISCEFMF